MTTARLNRIFTLRTRLPSVTAPTRFVYSRPQFSSNTFADGDWYMAVGPAQRPPPRQAAALLNVNDISLAFTDSLVASPDQSVISAGTQVFIFGPNDGQMLTYDVVSNQQFAGFNYFYLTTSGGRLIGDDFTITAGLTVGFQNITSEMPGPLRDGDVWARITERGSESGILAIETSAEVDVVTDTAEVTIRFIHPSTYTRLIAILDDLGRTWTIRSSRASEDRKYLALDCERDAT